MPTRLLMLIRSDPRVSHRPAEAIRIAAGVGAWQRAEIKVCLWGPAVMLLRDSADMVVDEEDIRRYLPMLGLVYIPTGVCAPTDAAAVCPAQAISEQELAEMSAQSSCLLCF